MVFAHSTRIVLVFRGHIWHVVALHVIDKSLLWSSRWVVPTPASCCSDLWSVSAQLPVFFSSQNRRQRPRCFSRGLVARVIHASVWSTQEVSYNFCYPVDESFDISVTNIHSRKRKYFTSFDVRQSLAVSYDDVEQNIRNNRMVMKR